MRRSPAILLVAAAAAGCEMGDAKMAALECFSIQDCPGGRVCFLGSCVDPNYEFTSVYAEMTPPSSSGFLVQAAPDPFDLEQGLLDISLRAAIVVTGTFTPENPEEEYADGGTLRATAPSGIPGRDTVRQATVSQSTFQLAVVPDVYDLSFASNQDGPPLDFPAQTLVDDPTPWNQPYPSSSRWVTVRGRVRFTADAAPHVAGALVSGTATGAAGLSLRSTSALTDTNGEYRIAFPPGAEIFCIEVGPGTNQLVPETTRCGLTLANADGYLDDIIFGLSPKVKLATTVRDAMGEPVSRASVIFDGIVGDGHFTTSGVTTDDGDVERELWPGEYTVIVAPEQSDPWALTTLPVTISSGDPVNLYVGHKVQLSGIVTAHDGTPVAGATVAVTRRSSTRLPPRVFTTATAVDGSYSLAVDPGDASGDAEYELEIQPDVHSRLPYFRELFRVGTTALTRDVQLYDATLAAGRVFAPGGTPLADVTIGFYSIDLGSSTKALIVGLGRTNSLGEFVVPLPQLGTP